MISEKDRSNYMNLECVFTESSEQYIANFKKEIVKEVIQDIVNSDQYQKFYYKLKDEILLEIIKGFENTILNGKSDKIKLIKKKRYKLLKNSGVVKWPKRKL